MGRIYLPDGSYKEVKKEKPIQEPVLTQAEMLEADKKIKDLLRKYMGLPLKEAFPLLKKEAEEYFAHKFKWKVEVKLDLNPLTANELSSLSYWVRRNYVPITIELIERIDWQEGDHEKELYEWKHRKDKKRAITSKEIFDKWK